MKVALCFSGNIRDLNETKNFWTDLINKYDIDVYASFWDVENIELGDTISNFLKIYTPKKYEIENYKVFKETTQNIASLHIESPNVIDKTFQESSKVFGQLPMYYKVWRCNMLSKQLDIEYDLIIRARIDTILDNQFRLVINDTLNVPMGCIMVPALPHSDGINDCFAYGKPKVMDYYSFILFQMMEYLKDGHYAFPPEHFLSVHFTKVHIPIRFFQNYIMITRVWKGGDNEIYNNFIANPYEDTKWSDEMEFIPAPHGNFKKQSIKDDFFV